MDIKDFILIGGGLLIAAVVAHGFWIAWRARREPLRMDIVPDLLTEDVDELTRLRAELPNGGARLARHNAEAPREQRSLLELEPDPIGRGAPVSAAATKSVSESARSRGRREPFAQGPARSGSDWPADAAGSRRAEPSVTTGSADQEVEPDAALQAEPDDAPSQWTQWADTESELRATVADVELSVDAIVPEPARGKPASGGLGRRRALVAERPVAPTQPERRPRRLAQRKEPERAEPDSTEAPVVDELIVINIMATKGRSFTGDALFAAMRGKGLKFGDMNIFHRVDPMTKAIQYSAANMIEPGTFEMADMEALRTPGVCLFMQLPGPDNPIESFEEMLAVARDVAGQLMGELRDEQRTVMTPQTVAHYRQRVTDFSRRRMSRRA